MNSKSENNLPNKKGVSRAVISLITAITAIVILVAGIGLLTTIEQLKSENVKLINKNTELMNENVELTNKLARTRSELDTTKHELEKATFKLGKDMLTLPKRSSKFDCDDSALYMYLYFTNLGYDVQIMTGNLDLDNETFYQSNHVWVWANDGTTGDLAYDWGKFCGYFNYNEPHEQQQHYYGYVISYRDLLKDALRDQ